MYCHAHSHLGLVKMWRVMNLSESSGSHVQSILRQWSGRADHIALTAEVRCILMQARAQCWTCWPDERRLESCKGEYCLPGSHRHKPFCGATQV